VRTGRPVPVRVRVTNTGRRAGEEVVQLYVRDDAASVTRPVRALAGFRRVSLAPGASTEVTFTIAPESLALYDLDMRRVIEPGTFTVWAGGSSAASLEARVRAVGDTAVLRAAPPRLR
jgi:beta-glucosidase